MASLELNRLDGDQVPWKIVMFGVRNDSLPDGENICSETKFKTFHL